MFEYNEYVHERACIPMANSFSMGISVPVDTIKEIFNSLPTNKLLDCFKLKAFADDKLNLAEELKFVFGRVENILGKGENAGYQHFLLFPQCFQKASILGSFKVGIVWYGKEPRG